MHDETPHMFHIKISSVYSPFLHLSFTLYCSLSILLCTGSRGVSIEQYLNIGGSSVSELKSSDKFPDQPDNFLTYPVFQPENSNTMYVCS